MDIKASCRYDIKALKAFRDIQLFGKGNPKTQKTIILVALYVVIAGLAFMTVMSDFDSNLLFMLVMMCVIGGLFTWSLFASHKLMYKNSGNLAETVNNYVFTDTFFTVESEKEGYSGNSKIAYDSLYSVYETSSYYFIYINKVSSFIVDKSSLNEEEIKMISEKLKSSVRKRKYIRCKY